MIVLTTVAKCVPVRRDDGESYGRLSSVGRGVPAHPAVLFPQTVPVVFRGRVVFYEMVERR